MMWEDGKRITFNGCSWNAGWEFDAPCVLYSPVRRYGECGSIGPAAIERLVEDVCIDLCVDGNVRDDFRPSEVREFEWRGWSQAGFAKRKSAIHAAIVVECRYDQRGERSFRWIDAPHLAEPSA